ncbi:hypothetical protein ACFX2A_007170 [Malus domestica]
MHLLLQGHAFWPQECRRHLPKVSKHDVQEVNWGNHRGLCRRHHGIGQAAARLHPQPSKNFQHPQKVQDETQPHQMHIQSIFRHIIRVPSNPMKNQRTSQANKSNPRFEIFHYLEEDPKLDRTTSHPQPFSLAVHQSMQALFQGHQEGTTKQIG